MSYNIPSTAWASLSGANQTSIGNPLTIGTNLVFSQSGLSGVRTFTLPNLSDVIDTQTSTNSLTNKTIDAGLQTLISQAWTSPMVQRYGEAQALGTNLTTAAAVTALSGALAAHVPTGAGTNTVAFDTTEGLVAGYVTGAASGQNAGLVSPTGSGLCRRSFYVRARTRCKVNTTGTSIRQYFGFTSASSLPISDTPLANGDSGVLIGYRSTDSVWNIFNNDGSGAAIVTATTGTTSTDTNYHTLEINWAAAGNVNVIIDGNIQTAISTRIPAVGTTLFFNNVAQTTASATANTLTHHATEFETSK